MHVSKAQKVLTKKPSAVDNLSDKMRKGFPWSKTGIRA